MVVVVVVSVSVLVLVVFAMGVSVGDDDAAMLDVREGRPWLSLIIWVQFDCFIHSISS